ncbi:nucleoporin [Dendrothele bispora CBS 962.96]|uniref:Nucleoporin n=1 Tax=Dendrothele bispora (strain CBS 962.96) TaxID=1314807 RepID=A0A4S8MYU7_DENBC|nr:nucleoporin [Dendrothele bispora CBS 962.96]
MASTSSFSHSAAVTAGPSTRNMDRNTPVDLTSLQSASKVLHEQFAKDTQAVPEISEVLNAQGGQASSAYSIFPDDVRVPFQKRKLIGIPEALFQYYSTTSVNSHMGLLPEIERVWVSIDHKLFLWDYSSDSQEINSFVDQPYVITHVALVKPKKGLFIDEISNLLVICTPVSVLLIALSLTPVPGSHRPSKEVKLYATDLTVSTEVDMTSVAGTPDGRIFMCGAQDGNLYELHYQENESWFGKRVQLINHSVGGVSSLLPRFAISNVEDRIVSVVADHDRNCLYTLTEKNVISVYKPTTDKSVQHIQTLSNLYKTTQDKCPTSPVINPQTFQLISLHPVSPSSRSTIQLLAVTTNGVRLYFSPSSYGYSYGSSQSSPRPLQLMHVRLPPSNLIHPDEQEHPNRPPQSSMYGASQGHVTTQTRPYIVSNIDNACYVDGLTIAAQQGDVDTSDYLLCMSPDLTRFGSFEQLNLPPSAAAQTYYAGQTGSNRPPLTEYATLLSIPGRTWAMAPVLQTPSVEVSPSVATINELATQFGESPRQFMILTNVGLTFLIKRRALDYLKAVIEELHSEGNVQPIIEFRDSFGRNQTCAMLLCLASGNTFTDVTDQPHNTITSFSPDFAQVAKQAFYEFGDKPIWSERTVFGRSDNQGTAIYSGRREGLALYLSRLVRPIWKSKLTSTGPSGVPQSAIPDNKLVVIQKNLYALKDLLDKNPQLFHSSPGDSTAARAPALEQEAWKAEQASVSELLSLLTRTVEALSFVLLLNDYRFGDLLNRCDAEVQKIVSSLTFEDLITTQNGLTASRALVNVIIDQQIGQQISVDTISEVLQNRCGSFCSTDDVMLYKAKENIRKAAETSNPVERQNWLAESLRLYTKGARILDLEKLREIAGDFQLLRYAKGAIELPLVCAKIFDQDSNGLEYWRSGASGDDIRREPYERRLKCYELVLDSLSVFEGQNDHSASSTNLPSEDLDSVRSLAYELAFSSPDEMFHSVLYDWLIQRGLADDLLEIRPPFLEVHLRREPVSVEKYQLLWQFYVKDGQPLRAAEVLSTLAESDQFNLTLDARLEYLTLAVGNAKSHPVSTRGRHETAIAFLTDLEEKLEVAQVQLEIYNTLLPHMDDAPEVNAKIIALSKKLLTMTELYQEYAVAFDLPILKLLCLHISEHRDEAMVKQIWNQIFDQIVGDTTDPQVQADQVVPSVVPLGQRFYPSESAFPLRNVADLLVRFSLERKEVLPFGWAPRILVQCGVPFSETWDVLHEMYESHVPPFNAQTNVQAISSDIAVLLSDWLEEAKRPNSSIGRGEFPVSRIDFAIDQYIAELHPDRKETKATYEAVKRQLRRNW